MEILVQEHKLFPSLVYGKEMPMGQTWVTTDFCFAMPKPPWFRAKAIISIYARSFPKAKLGSQFFSPLISFGTLQLLVVFVQKEKCLRGLTE